MDTLLADMTLPLWSLKKSWLTPEYFLDTFRHYLINGCCFCLESHVEMRVCGFFRCLGFLCPLIFTLCWSIVELWCWVVSGVEQSDSVLHTHIFILSQIPFSHGLSQSLFCSVYLTIGPSLPRTRIGVWESGGPSPFSCGCFMPAGIDWFLWDGILASPKIFHSSCSFNTHGLGHRNPTLEQHGSRSGWVLLFPLVGVCRP